jgi:hypothetical protein
MNKLFLCLTGIIVFACNTSVKKTNIASIVLERDTINIGKVPVGDSAEIMVKVSNAGNQPLNIKGIGYSCGCTEGKIQKNVIPPDDHGFVLVKYKNSGDIDSIYKTVIIESNAETPYKTVTLLGHS